MNKREAFAVAGCFPFLLALTLIDKSEGIYVRVSIVIPSKILLICKGPKNNGETNSNEGNEMHQNIKETIAKNKETIEKIRKILQK